VLEEHLSALRSRLESLSKEESIDDRELQAQDEEIRPCKAARTSSEELAN
jgi:hypothetical protein